MGILEQNRKGVHTHVPNKKITKGQSRLYLVSFFQRILILQKTINNRLKKTCLLKELLFDVSASPARKICQPKASPKLPAELSLEPHQVEQESSMTDCFY